MSAFPGVLSLTLLFLSSAHCMCFISLIYFLSFYPIWRHRICISSLISFLELQTDVILPGGFHFSTKGHPGDAAFLYTSRGSRYWVTSISTHPYQLGDLQGYIAGNPTQHAQARRKCIGSQRRTGLSFWVAWSSGPISSFKVRVFSLDYVLFLELS